MTALDRLPMELLLLIVHDEELQAQDYYNLALLSRTLNALCLPLYFKAYGMEYPHFRIDIHGGDMNQALMIGRRVISGLYAAVYLRPIPTLVFCIRFRPDSHVRYHDVQFARLRARLASATRLLRAIHSLDDVVIIGDEEWLWDTSPGPLSDFLLQEWVLVLGDFMNTILEKRCTSLQVLRGRRIVESFKFHQTQGTKIKHKVESLFRQALPKFVPSDTAASEDVLNGLRGHGWEFRRPGKEGYTQNIILKVSDSALQAGARLRHFHIHSTQFLLPPHLSWTLGVLRMSTSLVSLSFANITFDEPGQCQAVLSLIQETVSPTLKVLAFPDMFENMTSVEFLMAFFSRMKNLEHLELGAYYDQLIHTPTRAPKPGSNGAAIDQSCAALLPNLRSLSAPLKFSNYLLRARSWDSSRPIVKWRTFYQNADIHWAHDPAATRHFVVLFRELATALRERCARERDGDGDGNGDGDAEVALEITMKIMPTHDFYGFKSAADVLETVKPVEGVDCLVVSDGLLNTPDETYFRLGTFLATVFPDTTQVETKLVHPAVEYLLSHGRVPPALLGFLDWIAVFWPSVTCVVMGSWALSNISEGPEKLQILNLTSDNEQVPHLWGKWMVSLNPSKFS